jgi:hypothetical protein
MVLTLVDPDTSEELVDLLVHRNSVQLLVVDLPVDLLVLRNSVQLLVVDLLVLQIHQLKLHIPLRIFT